METRNVFIQVIKKPARKNGFTLLRATASPQNKRRLLFSVIFQNARTLPIPKLLGLGTFSESVSFTKIQNSTIISL